MASTRRPSCSPTTASPTGAAGFTPSTSSFPPSASMSSRLSLTVELEKAIFPRGFQAGFSGAVVTQTGGVLMVNLYTDPQEDVNSGIRHIPMMVPLGAEASRYQEVLKKYPPNVKVGFGGN